MTSHTQPKENDNLVLFGSEAISYPKTLPHYPFGLLSYRILRVISEFFHLNLLYIMQAGILLHSSTNARAAPETSNGTNGLLSVVPGSA
jgi:hypothetical protein